MPSEPLEVDSDPTSVPNPQPQPAAPAPPDPTFPAGYERAGYEPNVNCWEGGMGIIFRARETDLQRDVAVKLLRDQFTADGPHAKRFREEAYITAQLQHPSIPPVYRVGKLPNGRPFLVMKLIKGKTLKELLEARANFDAGRGRFLLAFEAIAQAMAYAHSKRVIHRDLKPANVMVGAFGEVQVMDWGLAKVLGTGAADSASPPPEVTHSVIDAHRHPDDASQDGARLGTPSFMAPEQALGEIADIGPPADVFGLGGILCVILTGYPPYVSGHVLARAAAWKIEDAFRRLDECGVDVELIALAKRCLAKEPADRYANAGEVAKAVADWRVVAEELARKTAIEEAAKFVAEAARERAKQMYLIALEGFNQMVFGTQKPSRQSGVLELRKQILSVARVGLEQLVSEAETHGTPDRTLLATLVQTGDVEMVLGNTTAALREYGAAGKLARRLADADPNNAQAQRDLGVSFNKLGNVALQLGRVDEAYEFYEKDLEVSQRLADAAPSDVRAQRDLGVSFNKLGNVALQLGRVNEAWGFYEKGKEIRQRLAESDPSDIQAQRDLGISFEKLGNVMLRLSRMDEARGFYEKLLEVAQRLADADPRDAQGQRDLLGLGFEKMGDVMLQLSRVDEAREFYEKGRDIRERLAFADPSDAQIRRDFLISYLKLGNVEWEARKYARAIELYTQSLVITQRSAHPEYFAEDVKWLESRLTECRQKQADASS